MLSEDQYMDRTPDLVAKIRKLRETAEKEMNRFTRIDDYDVRRVVGHGPKPAPASSETASPSPASEPMKKPAEKPASAQTSMEFESTPAERSDHGACA